MNTFKKIVGSPFVAAGWVAGQVKNGYDSATKAVEPAAKAVGEATATVKATVTKAAVKTSEAVKATVTKTNAVVQSTAVKVKDATYKAATKTKTVSVSAFTTAKNAVVSAYRAVTEWVEKTAKWMWYGITGDTGAVTASFLRTFAGIEYIFAFVYFCFAVAGLAFPGLGMSAVLASEFAKAGFILMGVGLVADIIGLWLVSISRYEYIADPFTNGRRVLVLNA